jgi:uncharacterized repeat protein (TIGR03833 family)
MDVTIKKNIIVGMLVDIIAEEDTSSGTTTRGYILKTLSQANHSSGIKVELTNGKRGRVDQVITKEMIRQENFRFYNELFFLKKIYSIWDAVRKTYLVIDYLNSSNNVIEKTSFIFDTHDKAKVFLLGTSYATKDFPIREINLNKPFAESFKKIGTQFVRINKERKLSLEKLQEWESYFKNMR